MLRMYETSMICPFYFYLFIYFLSFHSLIENLWLQAILSGCSAGGLTAILQCDRFKSLLPAGAKVKCLSDAGYFINVYATLICFVLILFLEFFLEFLTSLDDSTCYYFTTERMSLEHNTFKSSSVKLLQHMY